MVCDNFSPRKKREVTDRCAANDVEFVFTPSIASSQNWLECELAALRYFSLSGSDYPDHAAQQASTGGYIRWRNERAMPKTSFVVGSKIRPPDYPPKGA